MSASEPSNEMSNVTPNETPGGSPPERPPERPPRSTFWVWPLALVIVVAILTGSALYVFRSLRDLPGDAVDRSVEMLQELQTLAAAFRQGTIETRFLSYATEVRGTNHLQFATLEQTEIFRRRDESSLLWGRLPLPEIVVEATAPVTYTYYVDFNATWRFEIDDRTVRVLAPPIELNKPAIDASEIRFETRSTSVFRDEEAAMGALKAGLSEMAERRARESVPLIRELGRAQVREFVGKWITRSFGDGGEYHVEVVFADEVDIEEPERTRIRLPAEN